jgi:signal transduction histidine kinase
MVKDSAKYASTGGWGFAAFESSWRSRAAAAHSMRAPLESSVVGFRVMGPHEKSSHSEREQTDESLRVEREKADAALGTELSILDETADTVLGKARARADEVLAAARKKTDQQSEAGARREATPGNLVGERVREDHALRKERADADETLRAERAEQVSQLSAERTETDKDLLTERARADEALATRDDFLGIVSHDLRNMLNVVGYSAALIGHQVSPASDGDSVRMDLQRIQRSVARMNRLIGDLVDVASIEAGRLAVTLESGDPAHVATEAVDSFRAQASASGISLVEELVPPASVTAFDPARILQVLVNLLGNAMKFTPAGGKVVVRVERIADEIRFEVRDTGVGIPGDNLEAVFERFRQGNANDRRGVGLGLYIAKCIVQGHGGRIWAESTIGEGSAFCFTLPIGQAT